MADPSLALQTALYSALSAALLPVAVYDAVPPDAVKPYVVIGDDDLNDDSTKTARGWLGVIEIEVWNDVARGRGPVKTILGQIDDALQNLSLVLTGFGTCWLKYQQSRTERAEDGLTYLGLIRFEIRIEGDED